MKNMGNALWLGLGLALAILVAATFLACGDDDDDESAGATGTDCAGRRDPRQSADASSGASGMAAAQRTSIFMP